MFQVDVSHVATFLDQYQLYSHSVLEVIVKAAFSEVYYNADYLQN